MLDSLTFCGSDAAFQLEKINRAMMKILSVVLKDALAGRLKVGKVGAGESDPHSSIEDQV